MARTKSNEKILSSIEDADKLLREMGEIEAALEEIDNGANAQIAKIKEEAAIAGKEFRDKYKAAVKTLEAYARYFRADLFKDKKSMERPFGIFGFRKAPDSISVSKKTAELLKEEGLSEYVRTKIEPDKEAMLSLSDETLQKVEATRRSKEDFFVETKRDLPNQELAKVGA